MDKMFNFNFDTEEDKTDIVLNSSNGLNSPSKFSTKKVSYHSKQVSVDFFKLQLDSNSKNE